MEKRKRKAFELLMNRLGFQIKMESVKLLWVLQVVIFDVAPVSRTQADCGCPPAVHVFHTYVDPTKTSDLWILKMEFKCLKSRNPYLKDFCRYIRLQSTLQNSKKHMKRFCSSEYNNLDNNRIHSKIIQKRNNTKH